jgi:hypothetical protein
VILVFDPTHQKVRSWTHAEIEGPCFVATITSMHTGLRNRAAIIECAYELQYYLLAAKDVRVEHIHMMCPPSISGRSHWALEELTTIIAFQGLATEESAVVYRTAVTSYKIGELDLRRKKEARVLYSQRHLERHSPKKSSNEALGMDLQLYGPLWAK